MNIITNNCSGGYIYKDCIKCDFMNPFIWSSIDFDNLLKLVINYDTINFRNIKCELIENILMDLQNISTKYKNGRKQDSYIHLYHWRI